MSRWIFRALVSALLAAILLSVIPLDSLIAAIRRVSVWTWSASLGIFLAGHYLNALKLRLLLGEPAVPASVCVQAQYAGLVANLGLPGIAGGDLVRAGYLAPVAGTARVAMASIADRLIDTATLLVLVAAALPIAGVPPPIERIVWAGGWWIAIGSVAGAVLFAAAFLMRNRIAAVRKLTDKLSALTSRRAALAGAIGISLLVQAGFVLTNVWLAREVGVGTGVAAWFVGWPLSKLVAVLPISLGGLGVREAVLVSILTPYGAPADAVFASGILWQSVLAVSGLLGLMGSQLLRTGAPLAASRPTGEV
jgi:glycosyltransferase 2 family protein